MLHDGGVRKGNGSNITSNNLLELNDSVSKTLHNILKQQLVLQMNLENVIDLIRMTDNQRVSIVSVDDKDLDKEC